MPTKNSPAQSGPTIDLRPDRCTCGCGLPVTIRFRRGHDTRLKSALRAAHLAGEPVGLLLGTSRVTVTAQQAAEYLDTDRHSWSNALQATR